MNRRDSVVATIVAVLWGLNLIAGKIGVGLVPPLLFSGLRFFFWLLRLLSRSFRWTAAIGGICSYYLSFSEPVILVLALSGSPVLTQQPQQ